MSDEWTRKNLRLKDRHGWKSKPGYAICAMDRGAIRFDYPAGWHISVDSDSLKVRDLPEPDDNCVLAVSQMHLPPMAADQVPIRELVQMSLDQDRRDILERKNALELPRSDGIELAFGEVRYMDAAQKRQAFSRLAIARGSGVYCLMTFDFWIEDLIPSNAVWDEALQSLTLGMYVEDPTVGPVVH